MGIFKFISKPVKRYLFYHGDQIEKYWYKIVYQKYKNKFINKNKKINNQANLKIINIENTDLMIEYMSKLEEKLNNELGLAHSKVREYWLRRGPRLCLVLFITIGFTALLSNIIIKPTRNEHILSILLGLNMFLFNIYMLYNRLVDSISGNMMKIGHNHYVLWKSTINLN